MSGAHPDFLRPTQILAAAGSGKTYQLTNRYLGLVARGAPVGSILASTFTRAAAGEIRDRVLLRLAEAASDDEKRRALGSALAVDGLERAEILRLLRELTTNMHRIQIRTLDSFFGAVVRAFAIELGVPVDAPIVEGAEASALRHEAIQSMLASEAPEPFVELLRLLTQGASERSVMRVIDRAVEDLHELYRESDAAAWDRVPMRPELTTAQVRRAIEDAVACPLPNHAKWRDAHASAMASAHGEEWDKFLGSGLAAKIARDEKTYYRHPIDSAVVAAYRPLIAHAGAVMVNRMRDQTLATFTLLDRFNARYGQARARRGVMTFADVTAAVLKAQDLGTFPEICYRIDAVIRHLLLDEFQDTSIRQWHAVEPIAHEIVADETQPRTFFCVGDPKQSIYGWRDAAPEVLDAIPDLLIGPDGRTAIHQERLAVSYRASPILIDVINRVFGALPENRALEDAAEAAELFAKVFETHETKKRDRPGYAELRTVPRAEPGGDQSRARLRAAAELVRELHERAPEKEIAVLTRTNDAVARLLFEFSPAQLDLPASGRGGGPLTDSPAVNAVLDLLRLADHPDDTAAAFHVACSPLGPVIGLDDALNASARTRVSRLVRRKLLDDGYGRALAAWAARLAPACDERQHGRLQQLVERAGVWDHRATLRPGELVRIVEDEDASETRPAPVQVMTIHQAKGLEFDVVVLPELGTPLKGRGQVPVVVERRGATGPIERVFRWINKGVRPFLPEIDKMIERHQTRTARESLSVLYVAMTRAKEGLYMLIDPASRSSSGRLSPKIPKSAAGVLRCALAGDHACDGDEVLFAQGEPQRVFAGTSPVAAEPAPPAPAIRLAPPTGALSRVRAAAPASAAGGDRKSLAKRLRLGDEEAMERGRAVHRLFEQVAWYEDWSADVGRLLALVRRVAPRRTEAWAREVVRYFLGSLEKPEVRSVMSRGDAAPESVRIWRERRYAQLIADGQGPGGMVQQGSIDRLEVTLDSGGRPCSARLIDFKTDQVSEREATASAEAYRRQIDAYRSAAARMLQLDASEVTTLLLFVDPPVAVELEQRKGSDPSLSLPGPKGL